MKVLLRYKLFYYSRYVLWKMVNKYSIVKDHLVFKKAIKSALSWTLFIPGQTIKFPGMYLWGLLKKWKRRS